MDAKQIKPAKHTVPESKAKEVRAIPDPYVRNHAVELAEAGVDFDVRNNGFHLILRTPMGVIDYWPTRAKYSVRGERSSKCLTTADMIAICKSSEVEQQGGKP